MSDSSFRELYQEVILDHNKNPRNFRVIDDATNKSDGNNPLCGDQVTVFVKVAEGGVIQDVSFQGMGCAISKASASLMTTMVKGKTVAEADALFDKFHDLVMSGPTSELSDDDLEALGKMGVFAGVREYPARVKCASLPWHTVHAALAKEDEPVSTE